MNRAWQREVGAGFAWFLLAGLVGLALGRTSLSLAAAALLYFGWHAVCFARFYRWLAATRSRPAPRAFGIWGELSYVVETERRRHQQAQQRLTTLLDQYRASTAALPDGIVVLNRTGCITWFNAAAADLLGLRMPHDIGQRLVNLVRHPDFTAYAQGHSSGETVAIPAPGTTSRELLMHLIPYGDGQSLLIARDISESKRIEQIRRDFVANASHELRTPLTVLQGYLGMMNEDAGNRSLQAWREPLVDMVRQAARMERIVADMLALARLEDGPSAGEKESLIDTDMLVRRLGDDARAASKEHMILVASTPGLALHGRGGEIESAFANLIQNAIKHTPPGTTVRVRWESADDGAEFEVRDDGPGIDASHIPRLTERFYRVDESRSRAAGGTGLGLAIVKHVLERHDAKLDVHSQPGAGTSFTCRFPDSRVRRTKADAIEP